MDFTESLNYIIIQHKNIIFQEYIRHMTHLAPSSSGRGDMTLPLLAVLGVGAGGRALAGLSLHTEF